MTRLFHLILALAIGIATAYCGCGVAAASGHVATHDGDENVPVCCRHDKPTSNDHAPSPTDGHTCPHCAGKTAADAAAAKVGVAAPAVVPNVFLSFIAPLLMLPTIASAVRPARNGLPRPGSPQTLFDLACRFTT